MLKNGGGLVFALLFHGNYLLESVSGKILQTSCDTLQTGAQLNLGVHLVFQSVSYVAEYSTLTAVTFKFLDHNLDGSLERLGVVLVYLVVIILANQLNYLDKGFCSNTRHF